MSAETMTADDLFECTQCGECCSGYGGTYVSKTDIKRIADHIGSNPETFVNDYCDGSGSRFVLTQNADGRCIFFKKNCSIHPVKPYMCRAWPFIKTLVENPENWDAMANSCSGIRKGIAPEILRSIVKKEIAKLDTMFNCLS